MKTQVIVIGGGDAFETYEEYLRFLEEFEINSEYLSKKRWKKTLQEKLGDAYEVISPEMPNKFNAKYLEWKIWFDKFIPFFNDGVIFVGHSLGGIFLAKYLSENKLGKKIKAVFLLASPFDAKDAEYTLADFVLPESMDLLKEQGGEVNIYHSSDDPVVPFADFAKFKAKIPNVNYREFDAYGHFTTEDFPELIEAIKSIR